MKKFSYICPQCGETRLFKTEPLWEDFTKIGEVVICLSCGTQIPHEQEQGFLNNTAQQKRSDLNILFDSASEREKQEKDIFSDVKQSLREELSKAVSTFSQPDTKGACFCRDCKYFIKHPFVSRCSYHNKEVEPMDDCPNFIHAEENRETSQNIEGERVKDEGNKNSGSVI